MFAAESAVLVHFKSVGVILLVLHGIIVSLLALSAGQCYPDSHFWNTPYVKLIFGIKKKLAKQYEVYHITLVMSSYACKIFIRAIPWVMALKACEDKGAASKARSFIGHDV